MKLIPNWRKAWRMLSVQIGALAVIFSALPMDTQAAVLSLVGLEPSRLPGIIGLLVIAARLVSQPKAR